LFSFTKLAGFWDMQNNSGIKKVRQHE